MDQLKKDLQAFVEKVEKTKDLTVAERKQYLTFNTKVSEVSQDDKTLLRDAKVLQDSMTALHSLFRDLL